MTGDSGAAQERRQRRIGKNEATFREVNERVERLMEGSFTVAGHDLEITAVVEENPRP